MATQNPAKTKRHEMAPRPEAWSAARPEFPFFLSRLRDEFDRVLDRFSQGWPNASRRNGWQWGLDVEDRDDAVVVTAEAPGFEPGELDLRVSDDHLELHACKKVEAGGKEGEPREYREQEYYGSVALPPGIDKDKAEASYHNGILTLTLSKTAEGKGRRITIKT